MQDLSSQETPVIDASETTGDSIDYSYSKMNKKYIKTKMTIMERIRYKLSNLEFDFFITNIAIFIINIALGLYVGNYVIAITSSIALFISVIVYGEDYTQTHIWLLNQIAILSVIIPGICLWLFEEPIHRPLAGIFFIAGAMLYIVGLCHKIYGNSPQRSEREKWHLYIHLFTTAGHQMIMFETLLLLYLGIRHSK